MRQGKFVVCLSLFLLVRMTYSGWRWANRSTLNMLGCLGCQLQSRTAGSVAREGHYAIENRDMDSPPHDLSGGEWEMMGIPGEFLVWLLSIWLTSVLLDANTGVFARTSSSCV